MNTPTKVGIGLVSLVLICGGTPLFFYAKSDIPEAAGKMNQNIERAGKAGLWTKRSQLIDSYKVPETENSAPIFTALLNKTEPILKNRKPYWKNSRPVEDSVLADWAKVELDLNLLEEANKRARCKFKRDLRFLPSTELPEYTKARRINQLLAARASLAVQKNDVSTARRCWRYLAIIGQKLPDESFYECGLMRTSISTLLSTSLQHALNTHGRDPKWVDAVETASKQYDFDYDVKRDLRIELLFADDVVRLFMRNSKQAVAYVEGKEVKVPPSLTAMKMIPGIRQASISRFAEALADTMDAIGSNPRDSRRIQKALNDLDNKFKQPGSSWKVPAALTPIFGTWGKAIARDYAERAVIRNAVKALRKEPIELTKVLDTDEKPLRTRQTPKGLVIYSIGQDRKDNAGNLSPFRPTSPLTKDFGVLIPR